MIDNAESRPKIYRFLGLQFWWGFPISFGEFCDHHFDTRFYGVGHNLIHNRALGVAVARRRSGSP